LVVCVACGVAAEGCSRARSLAAIAATDLCAEDSDQPENDWGQTEITPSVSHFELWAGAQAFKHAWSLYSGATVAPFASIQQDGLRLRVVGGYGAYTYAGPRAVGSARRP
jgi:hypothetical protein